MAGPEKLKAPHAHTPAFGKRKPNKGGVIGGGVQGVTADIGGDFYVWPKSGDPRRRPYRDPYYRNV